MPVLKMPALKMPVLENTSTENAGIENANTRKCQYWKILVLEMPILKNAGTEKCWCWKMPVTYWKMSVIENSRTQCCQSKLNYSFFALEGLLYHHQMIQTTRKLPNIPHPKKSDMLTKEAS